MDFFLYIIFGGLFALSLIIPICYCIKSNKTPEFEEVPVSGHPSGLFVIQVYISGYFLKKETTVLKLREKGFSWSGDDCTVKVLFSVSWLRICHLLLTQLIAKRLFSLNSLFMIIEKITFL